MPESYFSSLRGGGVFSNRYVRAISSAQLIRVLGRSQAWIFIPLYLSIVRHVSYPVIGFLFFITAIISLPFSIYGGNLIDRFGRRKWALITPPLIMLIFIVISVLIFIGSYVYIIYVAFVMVEPLMSIQGILDNVVITDTVKESDRTNAFGIVRIMANIGFSAGPAIGGFLSYLNYGYVFLFPAVSTAVEWVIYILYIQETPHITSLSSSGFSFPRKDTKFIVISLLIGSIFFVAGQWGTTLTLFWSHVDFITNRAIGILYTVNGFAVVFLQMPTNILFQKVRDGTRIAIGGLIYSFSFLALAFFSGTVFLVIDVIAITMGENVISPVIYSVIGKMSPPDKRGQYFGAAQLVIGLVQPIAPLVGTVMLSYFYSEPLLMWGPLALLGIALSYLVYIYAGRILRSIPQASS
ncbi:MAG: MFS transporter [Thermoplasmataceae archaeon]